MSLLPGIPTQLTFILVHESAHACIAAHFFGPNVVRSIRYGALISSGGKPAVGLVTFTTTVAQLHARNPEGSAVVHLAGREAENMLGGRSKWNDCPDLEAAADACDLIAQRSGAPADYAEIARQTRRLLIHYWQQIEVIADALVRSDDAELRGPSLQRLLTIDNRPTDDFWR